MSTPKTAKELGFIPVSLAVDYGRTFRFVPEGQDHLEGDQRLVYILRPPKKAVVEQVQNTEIDFQVSDLTDRHIGHIRQGTTRKLFVMNCLVEWKNLYRQTGRTPEGEPTFELVPFTDPGIPESPGFKTKQEKNYEMIPDEHVTGIVQAIRQNSKIPEVVEGKSETTGDGGTE